MQDTEKINYEHYSLLFDGRLMGYDTETQGFDYLYEMLPYFVTTEITSKRREWEELGRLLDNACFTYKKPYEFLKFFYDAFYPLHLQKAIHEPIHNGTNTITLSLVTDYVIKWLAEKMENRAVNNDTENGLVIRGMYETLRPQPTPTTKAEVTGYGLGYTDTQLATLHGKLIEGKFLDGNTQLGHFINAFNGEVLEGFKPLKWIDKTPKNNAGVDGFNAQTLLEFLYLLEMESEYYDTLPSNQENFYRLLERVFEGIKNIQAKNITKKPNQRTPRQKLLKTIIQGIKP